MTDPVADDWEGETGERWLANLEGFEGMIAPVGDALVAWAGFVPGQRIGEVGCGGGANTFDIARAVAPGGSVTGTDISELLLGRARERLAAADVDNVRFLRVDAERGVPDDAPYDRLFSRFGVMFFDDTAAGFANMRRWLKPGGDFVFACWAAPDLNPWIMQVGAIVSAHVELPERDPDGPGPFRMADPEATRNMLEAAGYADIAMEMWRGEQHLGGAGADPASASEFVLSAFDFRTALAEAGGEELVERVRGEIEAAIAPHHRDGAIRMDGAAWFVRARNP